MALVPPNNQPAAANWERAQQGGGSFLAPRAPNSIVLEASPEGVYYATPGQVVSTIAGAVFSKGTDASSKTGWVEAT